MLVQCLEISEVPHTVWTELHQRKTIKYLRLISENQILKHYIAQTAEKMSNTDDEILASGSKHERETLTEQDLLEIPHETHELCYQIPLTAGWVNQESYSFHQIAISIPISFNQYILGDKCLTQFSCRLVSDHPDQAQIDVLQQNMSYHFTFGEKNQLYRFAPDQPLWDPQTILPMSHPLLKVSPHQIILNAYISSGTKQRPIDHTIVTSTRLECHLIEVCYGAKNLERINRSNLSLKLTCGMGLIVDHLLGECCLKYDLKRFNSDFYPLSMCSYAQPNSTLPVENPPSDWTEIDWAQIDDSITQNGLHVGKICNRTHQPLSYMPFMAYHVLTLDETKLLSFYSARHLSHRDLMSIMLVNTPQPHLIGQQYHYQISPWDSFVGDRAQITPSPDETEYQSYHRPHYCEKVHDWYYFSYPIPHKWDTITNLLIDGTDLSHARIMIQCGSKTLVDIPHPAKSVTKSICYQMVNI